MPRGTIPAVGWSEFGRHGAEADVSEFQVVGSQLRQRQMSCVPVRLFGFGRTSARGYPPVRPGGGPRRWRSHRACSTAWSGTHALELPGGGSSRSCSLASALQHRQAAPSHRGQPLSEIAPDRLGGHAGVVTQWKGAAASQFQACPLPNPPNSTRDDDRAVAPCLIVSMKRGGPADRTRGHIFAVPHHEPR